MTPTEPPGHAGVHPNIQVRWCTLRRAMLVGSRTYEITLTGPAGRAIRAEFEDCTIFAGPDTTTLRAELPDQTALWGLVERIMGLGLEVVHVHLVALEPR